MTPEELRYTKTHEWVRIETVAAGAKIATVGITSFALELLADLVFVDLPEVGRKVAAGNPFGELESVKAVSDLYSPVDGEVIEINGDLAGRLDTLADDPYETGWMVKIRVADESALATLLDAAAYRKQCEAEASGH